jgi:uracil-DNA glycosylase family 4
MRKIDPRKVEGIMVHGDGPRPAQIMIIGERPGMNEPLAGRPFIGMAGVELNRYLRLAGINREEVFVTNLVRDWRDDDPADWEIARDEEELLKELAEVKPALIVPVGRFAIRHFLGDVDVEQVHGLLHMVGSQAVYPCYHPAAGLHSPDAIQFIQDDFAGLADPWTRVLPQDKFGSKGLAYGEWGWPNVYVPLFMDTEGWEHNPWCLTFSTQPGQGGIIMAGDDQKLRRVKEWLANSREPLVLHNAMHDIGVLRALGVRIPTGRIIDTMILAYLLCLLPQGLKALAYRLAGMRMDSYDEVIAPGREVVWGEWMEGAKAVADQMPDPEAELVWDDKSANWRVKQPQSIGRRIARMVQDVEKKGILHPDNPSGVDIRKRVDSWDDTGAEALVTAIGPVPEPTLSDIPRERAIHYACRDADATGRVFPFLVKKVKDEGMWDVCMIDHGIMPMVERMQANGLLVDKAHMEMLEGRLTQEMSDKRDEIEAMVGVRINPSSPPQTAALLFKQLKLPSRKTTSTGQDSTQDKVLEGLRLAHPVVPLVLDYRELDKARGSFVRVALTKTGSDNRLRCNLRLTRVSSGRIAANTPNLMAIPVRSAIGKEIRQGFIAPPGKLLADWDLDQAEMRFMAHDSQDASLVDIFCGGHLDIHTDTAARMFSKPYADVDKNTERYAAKRVGFGVITGITGAGLVDQMVLAGAKRPDGGEWTEGQCDDLIARWFQARPGVAVYMDRCRAEARRQGWVADMWGRRRYLPGVWSSVERIREEACRQSHSHKIQAGAQGYFKIAMARIWWWLEEVWWPRGGRWAEIEPLLQIHDSLLFELPDDKEIVEEVDQVVVMEMAGAAELRVPMGAKGGRAKNWGDLKG